MSYSLDWYAAEVECEREGGHLMDMADPSQLYNWQNITIELLSSTGGSFDLLPSGGNVWLGLNRQIWLWELTGREVTWKNFSSIALAAEPVQECVFLTPNNEWYPTSCDKSVGYICQFSSSTTTSNPPITGSTEPLISSSTSTNGGGVTPGGTRVANGGMEPYIIVIIIICIICFIVIVVAIILACCGPVWMPRIRRVVAGGDEYKVNSSSQTKQPQNVDIAVSAHPSFHSHHHRANSGASHNNNRIVPVINVSTAPSDDSSSLGSQSQITKMLENPLSGGAYYSASEPPNDIAEIYTSPAFLYSYPSHRPLEPKHPQNIHHRSSSSSADNMSQTSTVSSPATRSHLRHPIDDNASNGTAPSLPPPFKFEASSKASSSSGSRSKKSIIV